MLCEAFCRCFVFELNQLATWNIFENKVNLRLILEDIFHANKKRVIGLVGNLKCIFLVEYVLLHFFFKYLCLFQALHYKLFTSIFKLDKVDLSKATSTEDPNRIEVA